MFILFLTIIKLKDNCPGFEFGQQRAVVNFMQGERSNVAMSNYFENMTIDIGKGNPGAVGLIFFANNSGAVRNVKIKSSDEHYAGAIGFWLKNEIASACNVYDLNICSPIVLNNISTPGVTSIFYSRPLKRIWRSLIG